MTGPEQDAIERVRRLAVAMHDARIVREAAQGVAIALPLPEGSIGQLVQLPSIRPLHLRAAEGALSGILTALQDNPELAAWFFEAIQPVPVAVTEVMVDEKVFTDPETVRLALGVFWNTEGQTLLSSMEAALMTALRLARTTGGGTHEG